MAILLGGSLQHPQPTDHLVERVETLKQQGHLAARLERPANLIAALRWMERPHSDVRISWNHHFKHGLLFHLNSSIGNRVGCPRMTMRFLHASTLRSSIARDTSVCPLGRCTVVNSPGHFSQSRCASIALRYPRSFHVPMPPAS